MISKLKMFKIEETLKDFKCLLIRYNEVRNDDTLLQEFCYRNRNPLFDITNIKFFKTGLKSQGLIDNGGIGVDDHYIQRIISTKIIFDELSINPEMTISDFILMIKKYSSTVMLTKDEHKKISVYAKKVRKMNYIMYGDVGIVVPGFYEYING